MYHVCAATKSWKTISYRFSAPRNDFQFRNKKVETKGVGTYLSWTSGKLSAHLTGRSESDMFENSQS
jgi:hypothetical protein